MLDRQRLQISDERRSIGGTIDAVQSAKLPGVPPEVVAKLRADGPEWLARSYFREAERLMLGLVRSRWSGSDLAMVLLGGPALICLRLAERRQDAGGVLARMAITGGLLARPGGEDGSLTLTLCARPNGVVARLTLENYQASPAAVPLLGRLYDSLQERVHALHGRRFLRRLALVLTRARPASPG